MLVKLQGRCALAQALRRVAASARSRTSAHTRVDNGPTLLSPTIVQPARLHKAFQHLTANAMLHTVLLHVA